MRQEAHNRNLPSKFPGAEAELIAECGQPKNHRRGVATVIVEAPVPHLIPSAAAAIDSTCRQRHP